MRKIVGFMLVSGISASVCFAASPDAVLPVVKNATRKVLIQTVSGNAAYPYNSYIITSRGGASVVVDPTMMPGRDLVDIDPAIIVSTHGHNDHVDAAFTGSYSCKKILYQKDDVSASDFRVYTIPSSHNGDTIISGGNVIAVIEVDGLRIAHMGDIGQTALTDDQLKALGRIDIAFMQFENSWSSMTLGNAKGFTIIEQIKPSLIIPTHYTQNALPVLEAKYGKIADVENLLAVSKEDIAGKAMAVCRILNTHKYR